MSKYIPNIGGGGGMVGLVLVSCIRYGTRVIGGGMKD